MRPANSGWWIGGLLLIAAQAGAHGGGLNAAGCHHDRKRGDYHCHRGAGSSDRNAYSAEPAAAPRAQRQGLAPLRGSSASDSGMAYYRNCAAARAAGAAPVRRGDPGYAPHLDRDNDGKGCE